MTSVIFERILWVVMTSRVPGKPESKKEWVYMKLAVRDDPNSPANPLKFLIGCSSGSSGLKLIARENLPIALRCS